MSSSAAAVRVVRLCRSFPWPGAARGDLAASCPGSTPRLRQAQPATSARVPTDEARPPRKRNRRPEVGRLLCRCFRTEDRSTRYYSTAAQRLNSSPLPASVTSGATSELLSAPTIYALSSAPGRAGVAVIRASGPKSRELVRLMAPPPKGSSTPLEPRRVNCRRIRHPGTGEILDRGLVVFFSGPESFTGEDVVEFHVHGGTAVVAGVLDAIRSVEGCRLAEAGEFSKRAFFNEKLDLTEVEGLSDLLNAETDAQRRQALRQAGGALKSMYESWRTQLLQALAFVEAVIDFGEDEQIEEDVYDKVQENVRSLLASMRSHLEDNRRGEILRNGINVVIFGAPNAGKSSFLNVLARRQAAIVSPIAGTTRDVIELALNVGGYPVVVGDTAGLRSCATDPIELMGIEKAQERVQAADVKICVIDVADILAIGSQEGAVCTSSERSSLDPLVLEAVDPSVLVVVNKCDKLVASRAAEPRDVGESVGENSPVLGERGLAALRAAIRRPRGNRALPDFELRQNLWQISCATGSGVEEFLRGFVGVLKERFDTTAIDMPVITQMRHRQHIGDCIQALESFLAHRDDDIVIAAEELRRAAEALGHITGRLGVEAVLDVVFREFCIGK